MHPFRLFGSVLLLAGCAQAIAPGGPPAASVATAASIAAPAAGWADDAPSVRRDRAGDHVAGSRTRISLPQREEHATRAGAQHHERSPGDDWSYEVATEAPSGQNPTASYLRVSNAYTTPIMSSAHWRFWNNAYDTGQREMTTLSVGTDVHCSFSACTRTETFDVLLTTAQARSAEDVRVRLTSKSGMEKTLVFPGTTIPLRN